MVTKMTNQHIQHVLEYIESHLADDSALDNTTLASIAGYSKFHFLRIFREVVKFTPADYIRKRRITEIAKHICEDDTYIADLAFKYGFNSKENFTRAFKNEHNILPTEFKSANCSLRLFEPFDFNAEFELPSVSICYLHGFSLVAYPFDNDFAPHCWNTYNAESLSAKLSGGKTVEDYGAMRWNREKKKLDYSIGIDARQAVGNIENTVTLDISGGLYAVFETASSSQHRFVDTIRKTWDWIGNCWLPQNGYKRRNAFELERYIESSRTYSETIFIPIEKEKNIL